ncbi:hypothetical protein IWX90DRAFT_498033 [Phyllosticta citrichinensis]|uniref:Major facilitator superfamily (MFS) profile domain-containing protein n=1 Tax=Phyllosticta citrichinensis TaxID=1130410 RepID=A0ABR1Y3Y2_9PEZI
MSETVSAKGSDYSIKSVHDDADLNFDAPKVPASNSIDEAISPLEKDENPALSLETQSYPNGFSLEMILCALLLSMCLVAQDMSSWGKAYKYLPLKLTFFTAVILFEAGSVMCGAAPNSTVLIVGRALTGVGGAGITGGCYIIIA